MLGKMWPRFRAVTTILLYWQSAFVKIKHQEVRANASLPEEMGRCLFVKGHRPLLRLFFLPKGETKHECFQLISDWMLFLSSNGLDFKILECLLSISGRPLADPRQACKRSTTCPAMLSWVWLWEGPKINWLLGGQNRTHVPFANDCVRWLVHAPKLHNWKQLMCPGKSTIKRPCIVVIEIGLHLVVLRPQSRNRQPDCSELKTCWTWTNTIKRYQTYVLSNIMKNINLLPESVTFLALPPLLQPQ